MEQLTKYIFSQVASKQLPLDQAKSMLKELKINSGKKEKNAEDIAIIGMACRFPGASSIEEYWSVLKRGEGCTGSLPDSRRKDIDKILPEGIEQRQYMTAGYLKEIDKFDAQFFRISPREAEQMHPAQRILMEVTWEALENAALSTRKLSNSRTGVYVGKDTTNNGYDYATLAMNSDNLISTGTTTSILASRMSYFLNLKGPAVVLDTACSSGLVALHMASQALSSGEIDVAVVSGVSLLFMPEGNSMVQSSHGKVMAFDSDADGTVWGEGVGVIVLKSLKKALDDKDNIHAIIKGSAVNNDGSTNGLTAPSAQAQSDVICEAWKDAGIEPDSISYIEAHGTGTKLGDPIEINGITMAFRKYTEKRQFCAIGSVKTNIGHLVGASGIASIIKVILALKHKMLPATINFRTPNTFISFEDSPVYINDICSEWDSKEQPRRAGVSSFGFSGTNCHVVLEEACFNYDECNTQGSGIFVISAKNRHSFKELLQKYCDYFNNSNAIKYDDFHNICYTAVTGRDHLNYRMAFISDNSRVLADKIRAVCKKESFGSDSMQDGVYFGKCFLISGKKVREDGEITEEEKLKLTNIANSLIKQKMDSTGDVVNILNNICEWYVMGADIDWEKIFSGEKYRTVCLPTYQFNRERHWIETDLMHTPFGRSHNVTDTQTDSLIDKCLTRTVDFCVFETIFSISRHWVLREHLITGKSVIPGTTYLEMAISAGKKFLGRDVSGLANVQFFVPLPFNENETRKVHTVIRIQDEKIIFTISSDSGGEQENPWVLHANGQILTENISQPQIYNTEDIEQRFQKDNNFKKRDINIMTFGLRWQNLQDVSIGENDALARLSLPAELKNDTANYMLHPALMDIATSFGSEQAEDRSFYLPFSYKSIHVYKPIPSQCYSRITPLLKPGNKNPETIKYCVEIIDKEGNVVVSIKDFILKKADNIRKHLRGLSGGKESYHKIKWIEDNGHYTKKIRRTGTVMVFHDQKKLSRDFVKKLKNEKYQVIEVCIGGYYKKHNDYMYTVGNNLEDFDMLFFDIKNRGISLLLHFSSIIGERSEHAVEVVENHLDCGIYCMTRIVKSILNNKLRGDMDIFVITDYVHQITSLEERVCPENATVIGLSKSISQEYVNLHCKCMDIDDFVSVDNIFEEINLEDNSFITAFRNGKRYTQQLVEITNLKSSDNRISIKDTGVYIITGGTGGIGLEIAEYLARKGKINIALIGRTNFPSYDRWNENITNNSDKSLSAKLIKLKELEGLANRIVYCQADVSNMKEMKEVINKLRKEFGRINGVIHSAGIPGDGFIIRKSEQKMKQVLAPKVRGTLILDMLTRQDDPDLFILFSSVASIIGGVGQSDYAAANMFLDAFTGFRTLYGLRSQTINWAAWNETGMAYNNGANKDDIFYALGTKEALTFFDEVANSNEAQIIIGDLNYSHSELHALLQKSAIQVSEHILEKIKKGTATLAPVDNKNEQKEIIFTLEGRNQGNYTETEKKLAKIWSKVLKHQKINIHEGFYNMGGDSIMATQLIKEFEAENIREADISDIFTYSTVYELAEYINSQKTNKVMENINAEKNPENYNLDDKIKNLISSISKGSTSPEEGLDLLNRIKGSDIEKQ